MNSNPIELITPAWPAPPSVRAFCTTRMGGVSRDQYQGLNLGMHVGDSSSRVTENRRLLPYHQHIQWLEQQHTNAVVKLTQLKIELPIADAAFTQIKGIACGVMTADCLPILVCNRQGTFVAAIHAGWRGLASGIIENTIARANQISKDLLVWLGPSLGLQHFEVGNDVKQVFINFPNAFMPAERPDKHLFDLKAVAVAKLKKLEIESIYNFDACTYRQEHQFYSYRRACHQGFANTGRMLSYIVLRP